jgi:hypothetical protein
MPNLSTQLQFMLDDAAAQDPALEVTDDTLVVWNAAEQADHPYAAKRLHRPDTIAEDKDLFVYLDTDGYLCWRNTSNLGARFTSITDTSTAEDCSTALRALTDNMGS